ncbi:MAG: hypothetical protein U9Q06_01450 [Nanoarchaeota archaeon]|nr:hypothetical protein [Nanoarchaeota archaeon]
MNTFITKAQDFFIIAKLSQDLRKFDVACSNYFKALSASSDFLLAQKNLFAKDHYSRFQMLKQNFPDIYTVLSSLFLTYRRTYTKEISEEETTHLNQKVKEVFQNAGIKIPQDEEIKTNLKKTFN